MVIQPFQCSPKSCFGPVHLVGDVNANIAATLFGQIAKITLDNSVDFCDGCICAEGFYPMNTIGALYQSVVYGIVGGTIDAGKAFCEGQYPVKTGKAFLAEQVAFREDDSGVGSFVEYHVHLTFGKDKDYTVFPFKCRIDQYYK
jgi:hypothetical protein